jgi:hypothetical protein
MSTASSLNIVEATLDNKPFRKERDIIISIIKAKMIFKLKFKNHFPTFNNNLVTKSKLLSNTTNIDSNLNNTNMSIINENVDSNLSNTNLETLKENEDNFFKYRSLKKK